MTTTDTPIFTELAGYCICDDPAVDLLRDLIGQGLNHWDACLIAFGQTPAWDAPPIVWRAWCAREARRMGNDLRDRLGLRREPASAADVIVCLVAGMQSFSTAMAQVAEAAHRASAGFAAFGSASDRKGA